MRQTSPANCHTNRFLFCSLILTFKYHEPVIKARNRNKYENLVTDMAGPWAFKALGFYQTFQTESSLSPTNATRPYLFAPHENLSLTHVGRGETVVSSSDKLKVPASKTFYPLPPALSLYSWNTLEKPRGTLLYVDKSILRLDEKTYQSTKLVDHFGLPGRIYNHLRRQKIHFKKTPTKN